MLPLIFQFRKCYFSPAGVLSTNLSHSWSTMESNSKSKQHMLHVNSRVKCCSQCPTNGFILNATVILNQCYIQFTNPGLPLDTFCSLLGFACIDLLIYFRTVELLCTGTYPGHADRRVKRLYISFCIIHMCTTEELLGTVIHPTVPFSHNFAFRKASGYDCTCVEII